MSEYDVCKHGRIRCAECAYVEELEDRIEELEQQNKRYREAIDYVMTAEATQYRSLENALEDIKFVINETLESDSDE